MTLDVYRGRKTKTQQQQQLSKMEYEKIVGMIHAGTSKTDVKMNENLNTSKLAPVLNRWPLYVNID